MKIFGKDGDPFAELRRLTSQDYRAMQYLGTGGRRLDKYDLQCRTDSQDWFDIVEGVKMKTLIDVITAMLLAVHGSRLMSVIDARAILHGERPTDEELVRRARRAGDDRKDVIPLPNGKREFTQVYQPPKGEIG
jgi:hypothetical protein